VVALPAMLARMYQPAKTGAALPATPPDIGTLSRFSSDGKTLLRFDPAAHVRAFDLTSLAMTRDLDIGVDPGARPCFPVGLYSPDGSTLYVANAGAGTVRVVDLARFALRDTAVFPTDAATTGAAPGRGAGPGTAALAPDGSRLYLFDGQSGSGLLVIDLTTLRQTARVLADQAVRAVWPSPDGATIFAALRGQDGTVALLHSDGSVAGAVQTGGTIIGFVERS